MGQKADNKDHIVKMLYAGMDIARFELNPYNQKETLQRMHNLREILGSCWLEPS